MIKKELNALENVLNDRPLSQVEVTLKKSLQVQLWEAAYAYESMLIQNQKNLILLGLRKKKKKPWPNTT